MPPSSQVQLFSVPVQTFTLTRVQPDIHARQNPSVRDICNGGNEQRIRCDTAAVLASNSRYKLGRSEVHVSGWTDGLRGTPDRVGGGLSGSERDLSLKLSWVCLNWDEPVWEGLRVER